MASLHIKSFGPIVDSTKIELTPLMVLIGRQSAGKSSFMKVLCFCRWIEKMIMVSTDDIVNQYTHYNRFVKELKQFHRLNDEYFSEDSEFMYDGDNITIEYRGVNGNAKIGNYITERVGQNASLSMHERNEISKTDNRHSHRRLVYQSAQLFIEEPEQNLYPESQKLVVLSLVRSLKKALANGSEQSMAVVTTHSPYVMSVVNVLLTAAIVEEKGLYQTVVSSDCILPSNAISGYFIDEKGVFRNIMDSEIPMLSGNDLDGVSEWVDDSISKLNEILFA